MTQEAGSISRVNGQRWGIDARLRLAQLLSNAKVQSIGRGNKGKKKEKQVHYLNLLSAFDIETTTLKDLKQAFMYIWQWCFYNLEDNTWFILYGRTWQEYIDCVSVICDNVPDGKSLVVLDHNLSFEFQFLSEYYPFEVEEVFATDAREVLKCTMYGGRLEWRCTMRHSNTSLSVYTKQWHVEHQKLSGDEYNYSIIRYPWTELTEQEYLYAFHDVLGLCEAYNAEMRYWHDDLYHVPMTSTGYVRRICKKEWAKINYNQRRQWMPPIEVLEMLEEAFRGGDTHANRMYATPEDSLYQQTGCIVNHDVQSWDRSSSYPDVMMNCMYPLGDWYRLKNGHEWVTQEEVEKYVYKYEKALLMYVHFSGLRLKNKYWGMPYIPKSKCIFAEGYVQDNGRILSADKLSMAITDVDWEILRKEYAWGKVYFSDVWYCRYRELPEQLKEVVRGFYRKKTELKGAEHGSIEDIEYGLNKALLNALYGMAAQHPLKNSICFINETCQYMDEAQYKIMIENEKRNIHGEKPLTAKEQKELREHLREEQLFKYNKRAFIPYSVGCWVTSWARLELHRSFWLVDEQKGRTIYADTDSNKFIGDVDFSKLNEFYRARSERSGAFAYDRKGRIHYMGVYEYEYTADFATMGAKKYCYLIHGKDGNADEFHVTIAGVNKKKGAIELWNKGGFSAFVSGTRFEEAGGVQGVYNDTAYGTIIREGHELYIGRNVCLLPDEYTLGVSDDYARLLDAIILSGKIDGHTMEVGDDE